MSFRSVPRALAAASRSTTTSTTTLAVRAASTNAGACLYARRPAQQQSLAVRSQQARSMATEHAIANPTLAGIEKRWEAMPPQEQAELWMQLRDRMKVDWHEMTMQEKKAAYWIAFGPHGPRAETPKGEGLKILIQVVKYVLISAGVFYSTRLVANPAPRTMTKEWQEATNEYALKEKLDPITGISSEGYVGKGFVQSAPEKK
ncbi:Cytochrome c oxidase subunit 5A [Onygenales sp. PD_40]|nr:Cytochrome c oxidase subunit 5A [Onygenales sp. PD_40]KAK2803003.1 Cytochrome c oxidase subunit 5A [Onygenales sp. PD_10]